jgi:hypothetical protein
MTGRITSMVQVAALTYRVVRRAPGTYDVFRVLDDVEVGTFLLGPPLRITARALDADHLREIAHAAIRQARTSWTGKLPAVSEPAVVPNLDAALTCR